MKQDLEYYLTHRTPRGNECFFPTVNTIDFYRDIFGDGVLEEEGSYTEGKYNGIIMARDRLTGRPIGRWYVHDDFGGLDSVWYNSNPGTDYFMSPMSYAGKNRTLNNARQLFALTFDIDNVEYDGDRAIGFERLMSAVRSGSIPAPTYTVTSGHGLHLYYVFEQPVAMYKNNKKEMQSLKKALTTYLWMLISRPGSVPQYQSINQAFRMPGSPTKNGKKAWAFLTGSKVTVEQLNKTVPAAARAHIFKANKYSWKEACEQFPTWASRIKSGRKSKTGRKTWTCNPSLYEWWKQKAESGVQCGRRYFCLFATAIFAAKCGIDAEMLRSDLYHMVSEWDKLSTDETNRLTIYDADCAMKGYGEEYRTFPINSIAALTGITIAKNKRNGRKQKDHLASCRERSRYKTTAIYIVAAWRKAHKHGGIRQCIIETGLSRSTVYKWWTKCLTVKTDGTYAPIKRKHKHIIKCKKTVCPDCGAFVTMNVKRREWTWKQNGKKYRKVIRICPVCGCQTESKAYRIHLEAK